MTLNLAQLLCVLRREENWSRERTARRAQPAGSPAGITESAHHPAARGPRNPARASAQPRRPQTRTLQRGIEAKGENGAKRRGTEDCGVEKVGKEENLRSGGLREGSEVSRCEGRPVSKKMFYLVNTFEVSSFNYSPPPHKLMNTVNKRERLCIGRFSFSFLFLFLLIKCSKAAFLLRDFLFSLSVCLSLNALSA